MDIHEHQAKELLKEYNIPTPKGKAVFSVEEALIAAKELPGRVYVVKAQIHAGGRGKAGGVKVVKDLEALKNAAETILGQKLITHQTSSEGKLVQRLYIEDGKILVKEGEFSTISTEAEIEGPSLIRNKDGNVWIETTSTVVKLVHIPKENVKFLDEK